MSLFSSPKPPSRTEVPKPPSRDDAREAVDRQDELRRRRGRASTVLAGLTGPAAASGPTSAGKVLTGVNS